MSTSREKPPDPADGRQYLGSADLPRLPPALELGRPVPVARWISPTTAALVYVSLRRPRPEEGRPSSETDTECFHLDGSDWVAGAMGGSGWKESNALTPLDLPTDNVELYGKVSDGYCTALYGSVGSDACVAEVEQSGVVTRRDIDAPLGLLVVCAESTSPFVARVFREDGALLHEHHEPARETWALQARLAARAAQLDNGGPIVRTSFTVMRRREPPI